MSMSMLLLAVAAASVPSSASTLGDPLVIRVDCSDDNALSRVIAKVGEAEAAELVLFGTCKGGIVLHGNDILLRGGDADAGIALPADPPLGVLVDVDDGSTTLQDLRLIGGGVGIRALGQRARVSLVGVEVAGQGTGVWAVNGATVRIENSVVRDASIGIRGDTVASLQLDDTVVTGHQAGIGLWNYSRANIYGTTIEDNLYAGLLVGERSTAGVGATFRENGVYHILAEERSDVTLLSRHHCF